MSLRNAVRFMAVFPDPLPENLLHISVMASPYLLITKCELQLSELSCVFLYNIMTNVPIHFPSNNINVVHNQKPFDLRQLIYTFLSFIFSGHNGIEIAGHKI